MLFRSIISGIINGTYMPIVGILFGSAMMDLLETDHSKLRNKINLDSAGYIILGLYTFVAALAMGMLFGYVGSKITYKIRDKLYSHIMTMHIGWFDLPENLPSNLNNNLSEGTEKINDLIGIVAGTLVRSISSILIAACISFAFSWKMALIILVCIPINMFCFYISAKFEAGFALERENLFKDSVQILAESVKNFRTVASFSSEKRILDMYSDSLKKAIKQLQSGLIIGGILFGFSQMMMFLNHAAIYYFSAIFLNKYNDNPKNTFIAAYSLLFSSAEVGQIQQYSPSIGRAYAALLSIFGMFDQKTTIESPENHTNNEIKGKIEFKNVYFKYPTRNDYVLKNFNATIDVGSKVAIVGISGSGKSTIIQLIERFYDVESGEILIDGVNIKEYSLTTLRQSIGFVSQEPVLFDTTIEENVKYGSPDKTRKDVEEACQIANATDFIIKDSNTENLNNDIEIVLPSKERLTEKIDIGKGYERKVGAKGSLLSGGQKQRLAIARAVLKKPKIMLFDEATSALDSETEKTVQKALNQVSQGRTSVVIAHRLGTIEDNDTILVLENGTLKESGKKQEIGRASCRERVSPPV